jgi:predicted amidohydrolase
VVFANRVGAEDGVGFWGGSQVLGPDGDILAQAPLFEESLITADLDPGAVRRVRVASPIAAGERIDFNARAFAKLAGWSLEAPALDKKSKRRKR